VGGDPPAGSGGGGRWEGTHYGSGRWEGTHYGSGGRVSGRGLTSWFWWRGRWEGTHQLVLVEGVGGKGLTSWFWWRG